MGVRNGLEWVSGFAGIRIEDQDILRDILSRRIVEHRRDQIASEIKEARAEYEAGGCRSVSVDDLMKEISS